MPSTEASAAARKGGRKRGRGRPPAGSRARKKQKRLDAIVDKPAAAVPAAGEDHTLLRRSCRVRRAPQVLDASPLPSVRRRPRSKLGEAPAAKLSSNLSSGTPRPKEEEEEEDGKEEEMGDWRSRLRSRAGKGKGSGPLAGKREIHLEKLEQPSIEEKEKESLNPESNEIKDSVDLQPLGSRRRRKRGSDDDILEDAGQSGDQHAILPTIDQEDGVGKAPVEEEIKVPNDSLAGSEGEKEEETAEESQEARNEAESMHEDEQGESNHPVAEETALQQLGNVHTGDGVNIHLEENPDGKSSESDDTVKEATQSEDIVKEDSLKLPDLNNGPDKPRMKEGRRCGLCGGGTDGRPPKKLAQESTDSDKEAYEGSSASEEPNYDVWDGFGDEPGWLGRLLGPIHDRFGIARVWVHQHCAVWSPEVYFAGLGCLKNVRAALCRGRALKCSRCGRPGATIGCRVDRCPKTYHLPCSRAEGCIFDHRKFLIACSDHRHLFQPQGNNYAEHIRKMKAKKLKSDLRKISNDAFRKDLEAEEKWLENCGEDEEFLRREGKRLHRDLSRIAPIYIGGSSENDKSYQGWESVAGLQDVIQCMKEVVIIPLLYPEFFSNMGLTPPRGVLLHGYPGTGKTLVVRALIGACSRGDKQIAYFARKGADCLGKYVGDAERQLRLLFQVAERSQPSIIFFDEIDGLAPRRSGHQDQTHSSVVSTLLSLLDGLKSRGSVIVIGATNRPDAVDPALRRPGRFDREIYFPLPSVKDRYAILSLHTKNWPNPIPKPLLSWIASQTAGYAGADLQSLCTQAAMNALKRNCALQEILSSAEKASGHGRPPHLPSFVVEERDWLAALEFASPPCSRRESGMAANDVVSSPLHAHLFPCLLGPLLHLLISLYIDERIKLPPSLLKASESIRTVIFSSLEQKGIPVGFWWLHLHSLIQEPYVAKEIEKNLSCHGLLIDRSGYSPSYALDDDIDDHCKFGSCKPVQKFPVRLQRTLGFRALIAGIPRSGQQHLASCLLHGFMGHIEIQKINLATIAQEGHGDIIRGLTQILLKCMSVERCIIYMPRIDLWAIDDTAGEAEEGKISPKRSKSFLTLGVHGATKYASEMWSSFVEQVNSVCTSASIIILATCEVPNHDLPDEIRQFFSGNVLNRTDSAPSENSTPRFSVHLDGNFDHDLVINSAAAKLSKDLVQHYVQLVYHRTHMVSSHDGNKVSHTPEVDSRAQKQSIQSEWPTEALDTSADSERAVSNIAVCCRDERTQQGVSNYTSLSSVPKVIGNQEVSVQLPNFQDSFPKFLSSKIKGTSSLIIATFGYQILRYPQFAELCWVTSKLKDGPCTDINGPLKGWPFNTCITRISSSPGKAVAGASSSNLKDKESSVMVRGLVAVGLMAYRGVYTSVREVSLEVRKVLDLLVGHIRAKILGRKDRYRYLRLLSQVAYLEDMVNSWVYAFQSLPVDDQVAASTTKHVDAGRPCTGNNMSDGKPINNDSNMQSAPTKSCEKLQEISDIGSPWKFANSNGESVNASKGSADSVLPNSDMSMTPEVKHCHDLSALASLPTSLHLSSFTAAHALVSGDGVNITEVLTSSNGLESVETDHPIDTNMPNSGSSDLVNKSCSRVVTDKCTCLETVHSVNNGSVPDVGEMFNCTLDKRNNFSLHGLSCFYDCCSGCLHVVNELVQNILSDYWNSRGHHSTVDDLHDVIASCSSNVLSGFRKYHNLQSASGIEDGREQNRTFQEEHCACQEVGADQTKGTLFQHKIMRQIKFLPTECSCHIRNKEDIATEKMQSNSLYQPSLKFFFRDGVLISPDPNKDTLFHCGFENICVCSIIKILLMIKHPSD